MHPSENSSISKSHSVLLMPLLLTLAGTLIATFPNIVCFLPEWNCICTPECKAIHICYFLTRLTIFATTIYIGTLLYRKYVDRSIVYAMLRSVLPVCAVAYAILFVISAGVSKFIITDARGSILILQFMVIAILIPNIVHLSYPKADEPASAPVATTSDSDNVRAEHIIVKVNDNLLPITLGEIAYFYSSNHRTSITTLGGNSYDYTRSLDTIMREISSSEFFRANKQFIISKKAVEKMTIWFDNRLLVTIKGQDTPEPIYLSKNKAAMLKRWFAG